MQDALLAGPWVAISKAIDLVSWVSLIKIKLGLIFLTFVIYFFLSIGIKVLKVAVFYFQITTLINHKDNTKKSDKTLQAIQRVGQAVNLAVGRFVKVGEAIANENWDLKEEINIACIEAKQAGM